METFLYELDGGRLSLDFANTLGGMRGYRAEEHLGSYAELVEFGRQTGMLSPEHAGRLLREAQRDPTEAQRVHRRGIELREAIFRAWQQHCEGKQPDEEVLGVLNRELQRSGGHQRLIPAPVGCCGLAWEESDLLDAPLWPLVKDAVELLTSPEASRVRICEMSQEHRCSWVFLDETRNATRRWCSMKSCGNRAKAHRHYQRVKQGRAGGR